MALNLGSFAVREVLYGIAGSTDGDEIYFTLDQLSSAQIEVSSDPTEITDKNGNVIKTIYKNKTATFTATSALLSPALMNAASGSEMSEATEDAPIVAPKVVTVAAGASETLTGFQAGTVAMVGISANGANIKSYSAADIAGIEGLLSEEGVLDTSKIADADADIVSYIVSFKRSMTAGLKLSNSANVFPKTMTLTLYVAIEDPCEDEPRAAYVVIPKFQADPSATIAFDSDSTEMDFTGTIQTDVCSCGRELYYIVFPDENAVIAASCKEDAE